MNLHPGSENMQRARSIVYNLQAEIHQALSGPNNLPFELVSRLQQWKRELQVLQLIMTIKLHKISKYPFAYINFIET